ncbi:MAG TPA: 6-bladed beta-propeller [Longimicrobiaceae bacterium]|nr:6-bladed beta-propeller [Longimicrobiaceae bacterium]
MIRRAFAGPVVVLVSTWLATGLSAQVVRLPAADAALAARPVVSFAVGAAEGRDWEVFANVGDVAFDSRENLYVLDRGNARVVVFDPAGRHLRTFGRRGNGPGEFSLPQRMTVSRGDEVVVSDVGRRAFSVFGPDGAFRRSVPFVRGMVTSGSNLAAHPQGGVVAQFIEPPRLGPSHERVFWQVLGGGVAKPLYTSPAHPAGRGSRPVFSPTTRFSVLPGGSLALAATEAYSVAVVGPAGSVSRVLERAVAPRRVTSRDRAEVLERREALAREGRLRVVGAGGGSMPAAARARFARELMDVEFAPVVPVIQALQTDAAGNLWIQRTGSDGGRPGPIDIVTPQGRYVGTLGGVRLPDAFSPRGRAAYVETNDLGVESVVVVRLPRRWR